MMAPLIPATHARAGNLRGPEDHDPTDENAAYALAEELVPGHFGIYYQIDRPSKQDIEAKITPSSSRKPRAWKTGKSSSKTSTR